MRFWINYAIVMSAVFVGGILALPWIIGGVNRYTDWVRGFF